MERGSVESPLLQYYAEGVNLVVLVVVAESDTSLPLPTAIYCLRFSILFDRLLPLFTYVPL